MWRLLPLWLLLSGQPSRAADIWLAPVDGMARPSLHLSGTPDFQALFTAGSPWQGVSRAVAVFKLYGGFVRFGDEQQLAAAIAYLNAHHIALAVESGALLAGPACGDGVEGYDGVDLRPLVERIARLGGHLRYLALDEPLFYGTRYAGHDACHATPEAVARQLAATLAPVRQLFPDVAVGDIEPFPVPEPGEWDQTLLRWPAVFQAATGERLAFLHLDVLHGTGAPWLPRTVAMARALRAQGMPIGVIYNGNAQDFSDYEWAEDTSRIYTALEAAGVCPDHVLFQSWNGYPTHVLPQSNPGSLTGIVARYLARARCAGQHPGPRVNR